MLRNARHDKILELIEEMEIETQEELCDELSADDVCSVSAVRVDRFNDNYVADGTDI